MEDKYQELKTRLSEVSDIDSVAALLNWDQTTFMPAGGNKARARQMATLARISQTRFTDPEILRLLDDLQPWADSLTNDSDEASLIRVTRRLYERAVRIPPDFLADFYQHSAVAYQVWTEARPANDFKKVLPFLEKTLDFSRRMADFFPGYEHIADPLINFSDYGMKASSVRKVFAELRKELVPIVQAITSQPVADDSFLKIQYSDKGQWDFGMDVVKRLGFNFERGRQDRSPHPFTTSFSINDVRITTRIDEHNFVDAFFSSVHEAGHGMYEQGIGQQLEATPLAGGTSAGVHESQSRLWENIVARSRGFWKYFYPRLQQVFPSQLANVSLDAFYRAINKVERSLIRTDADEVTYNLHVMLRFDLELELLEGKLQIRDLPDAWNDRFRADLGVLPPDDRLGVMQDVHWYGGVIGGSFQGYALGNILSGMFYNAALQAHPEITTEIENGKFDTLHTWLVDNIYRHGRKLTADELVEKVTGSPMQIEPYIKYLRTKYGELYQL